jgi:hypothetical protein
MFTTYRDDGEIQSFDTEAEAITWGRECESFEVHNDDDMIVYQEFPVARWV